MVAKSDRCLAIALAIDSCICPQKLLPVDDNLETLPCLAIRPMTCPAAQGQWLSDCRHRGFGGRTGSLRRVDQKLAPRARHGLCAGAASRSAARQPVAGDLGPRMALPVAPAEQGTTIEKDRIYVIPPNTNLAIADNRFALTPRQESPGQFMPIDHFFCSLAMECGGTRSAWCSPAAGPTARWVWKRSKGPAASCSCRTNRRPGRLRCRARRDDGTTRFHLVAGEDRAGIGPAGGIAVRRRPPDRRRHRRRKRPTRKICGLLRPNGR